MCLGGPALRPHSSGHTWAAPPRLLGQRISSGDSGCVLRGVNECGTSLAPVTRPNSIGISAFVANSEPVLTWAVVCESCFDSGESNLKIDCWNRGRTNITEPFRSEQITNQHLMMVSEKVCHEGRWFSLHKLGPEIYRPYSEKRSWLVVPNGSV